MPFRSLGQYQAPTPGGRMTILGLLYVTSSLLLLFVAWAKGAE